MRCRLVFGAQVGGHAVVTLLLLWLWLFWRQRWAEAFKGTRLKLEGIPENLVDLVWDTRPPLPTNAVFKHPVEYAGQVREENHPTKHTTDAREAHVCVSCVCCCRVSLCSASLFVVWSCIPSVEALHPWDHGLCHG